MDPVRVSLPPERRPRDVMERAACVRTAPADRWRRLTWWQRVLVVFLLGRLLTGALAALAATTQTARPSRGWPTPPTVLDYIGNGWDAVWYQRIAAGGYPSQLAVGADGSVAQNEWAFYPLFPGVMRVVMEVTRLSWSAAALIVSLAFGAAACLVIYRLVASTTLPDEPGLALRTVLLVSIYPASMLFEAGYSEALALFLVALCLLLIRRRAYLWACLPTLALGFTRAVALPMLCVVLWHAFRRWRAQRREPPTSPTERRWTLRAGLLLAVTCVAGVVWQVVAAVVTGRPDAYFVTQGAWSETSSGFVPFGSAAHELRAHVGPAWPLLAAVGVGALCWVVLGRAGRSLGPEMQAWSGAYIAYLMAVIGVTASVVRFGLLAFPLLVALARWARPRWLFAALAVLFVLGNVWWVFGVWHWSPGQTLTP